MKTSSSIHSLVCFFLCYLPWAKFLQSRRLKKRPWSDHGVVDSKNCRKPAESYQHLEGDMQVALARTKPNIELPKGDPSPGTNPPYLVED